MLSHDSVTCVSVCLCVPVIVLPITLLLCVGIAECASCVCAAGDNPCHFMTILHCVSNYLYVSAILVLIATSFLCYQADLVCAVLMITMSPFGCMYPQLYFSLLLSVDTASMSKVCHADDDPGHIKTILHWVSDFLWNLTYFVLQTLPCTKGG